MDVHLTVAALRTAIECRRPSPGLNRYADPGTQYATEAHRAVATKHSPVGSMDQRRSFYNNAKSKSFIKILKFEDVDLLVFKNFAKVAAEVQRFIEDFKLQRLQSALRHINPEEFEQQHAQEIVKTA